MAHDAFISYSTQDKVTADAVCATLEAKSIRCWIAPRDVLPGMNWAGAIIDALHRSRILILVFSANSNGSPQVMQEVERAASKGIPILPFRIENILPSDAMEYFLGSRHWLDAMTPPMEQHLQHLATTVQLVLDQLKPPAQAPASASAAVEFSVPGAGANFDPVATAWDQPSATPLRPPRMAAARRVREAGRVRWRTLLGSRYRWPALGGLATVIAVSVIVTARWAAYAGPSLTPAQLYNALLASPVAEGELPPGFFPKQAPDAANDSLSRQDKQFHAVGQVVFRFSGPDWTDSAFYTTFSTAVDARGAFDGYTAALTPAGFHEPTKCLNGSGTSDNQKYGYTACIALAGNTYVYANSNILGDAQEKGNLSSATTLLRLGLAHLQRVRANPPRPLSGAAPVTATPGQTATPVLTPVPTSPSLQRSTSTPTPGSLPAGVSVVAEDDGSKAKVSEAQVALSRILTSLSSRNGLTAQRRLTVHLFSDEATARNRMPQLGFASADVEGFFNERSTSTSFQNTSASDAVVYLPQVTDLPSEIAFEVGVYFLAGFGAFEKTDTYPVWFRRGFEGYEERAFTSNKYDGVPMAASDVKAGKAPPLSSIASESDANRLISIDTDGANKIFNRGQAALVYLAERYGDQAPIDLLKGNAFGSINNLNDRLQGLTRMTLDQFNGALDTWLRQR